MQHTRSGKGGVIQWDEDDWKDGLAVGASFSNTSVIGKTKGAAALTGIDVFRNKGFIQPGVFPSSTANSSELGGAVVAAQVYSDGNTIYGVDRAGKIQKYTIITHTLTASFHTIAGTAPVGQDCVIYRHNSGGTTESDKKYSFFYSYYNNANWDVGAYINLVSPTFDDDFMSSVPTTPLDITSSDGDDAIQRIAPHVMCVGSDDILYIGSGRFLHAYDGSLGNNGTFQRAVLTFPAGFQITGILKDDDNLLIAGNYTAGISGSSYSSGEALVYVWDYNELDVTKVIPLDDPMVHSIFRWRGVPCVITSGASSLRGINRLKQIIGNNAVKLTDIGSLSAPGFRSIDSTTSTLYVNCGGNIITVGDPLSDTGFQVNNLTSTTDGTPSGTGGWVRVLSSGVLLASSDDGSATPGTIRFVKFDASGFVTAQYRSMFYEPPFVPGFRGRITKVFVYFKNTVTQVSGKNHIISFWLNNDTTDVVVVNQDSLTGQLVKKYFQKSNGESFPEFENISLRMVWQNGSSGYSDTFAVSKVQAIYEDVELSANS